MRRIITLLTLVMIFSIFIVGCGKSAGSEFIGKWVNIKSESYSIEVKKNGDNFIVAQTTPNFFSRNDNDKETTSEYPAILKDGVLTINAGLGPISIAHVKDDDTLLVKEGKYKRQK